MINSDSKTRFSNRVENYVKFRPDYPQQILTLLRERMGFTPSWKIADVGSGTGICTRMFLENGNEVFAVEPNAEMRAAAEKLLAGQARFHSVNASAEETSLADALVDLVVSAQAFHWFDPGKCQIEFRRILKPGGNCLLIWNERITSGTPFLEAYESLLRRCGADYMAVRHERVTGEVLKTFFGGAGYQSACLPNRQSFDLDGLIGRCLSSSYAPAPGEANHEPLLAGLRDIFARYQTGGRIDFEYETRLYWGPVEKA
jgi:SAM-dependent methyltransferase